MFYFIVEVAILLVYAEDLPTICATIGSLVLLLPLRSSLQLLQILEEGGIFSAFSERSEAG